MKHRPFIILALCLTVLLTCLGALACDDKSSAAQYSINPDITGYQQFSIDIGSVGLETRVHGSVFTIGSRDRPADLRLRIVAWVEIDPDDWAGVELLVPQGWEVSQVVSDYPQGKLDPDEYVAVWQTGDTDGEWHMFIDIGYSKYLTNLAGGGQGSVSIELKPISTGQELPDSIDILIGAGSQGDTAQHPCYQRITVALPGE